MLNFKLDTFLSLCETRSYTRTAEYLHITQPAVTQHIKYLESYYGTKLLYYDEKKRIHLTEHGRLLRAYAQTVKADSEILKRKLASPLEKPDELKIGSLTTIGESLVPRIVARYLETFPDKKISIYLGETDDLLVQLKNGRVHFCIVDTYCPPDQFESGELFESETVCICSPRHPLAGKTVDFKDLNHYRLIFLHGNTNSHRNLRHILRENNQDVQGFSSYVEVGTMNTVRNMVIQNIGISFIYRFAVQKSLDNGSLSQIHIKNYAADTHFNFVWMKNSFFSKNSRDFLQICREYLDLHGTG